MPESRQSASTAASRSSLSSGDTVDTRTALNRFHVQFKLGAEAKVNVGHKRPYNTNAPKTTKGNTSPPKPVLKNSLQKLRILGPQAETKIANHADKAETPQNETSPQRKFDAVSYFRQLANHSKQIQAGLQPSHLGVQGVATRAEQQTTALGIAKSGIIDHAGNIDEQLALEKKLWPVVLRSILKLHANGRIKMMIHIADGYPHDDWNPGYYMRPVFHCDRCYKHFTHHGDIDPTCQETAFPILGPWFIVGPATVKFVLSVSKMIESQLDVSRSRILVGKPSHRPLHDLTVQDIRAGGPPLAKGLRLPRKHQDQGIDFSLKTAEMDYVNFTTVESKIFDAEEILESPSVTALKELAFRGVPAYEDIRKKSLYKDRKRVDVTGEISHRKYHGLPDIIKHFMTPTGREELRTSMSSEIPAATVEPTELYEGVAVDQLVELRDELTKMSSDTLLSDKLVTLTEDLLQAERKTTEARDKMLKAPQATSPASSLSPAAVTVSRKSVTSPSSRLTVDSGKSNKLSVSSSSADPTTARSSWLGVGIAGLSLDSSTTLRHPSMARKSSSPGAAASTGRMAYPRISLHPAASQNLEELVPKADRSFLTIAAPNVPTIAITSETSHRRLGSTVSLGADQLLTPSSKHLSGSMRNLNLDEEVLRVQKKSIHGPVLLSDHRRSHDAKRSTGRIAPESIRELLLLSGAYDRSTILHAMKFAQNIANSGRRPTKTLTKTQLKEFMDIMKQVKQKRNTSHSTGKAVKSNSTGNILYASQGREMDVWFEGFVVKESTKRCSDTDLHYRRLFQRHKSSVSSRKQENRRSSEASDPSRRISFLMRSSMNMMRTDLQGRQLRKSFSMNNLSSGTWRMSNHSEQLMRPLSAGSSDLSDLTEQHPYGQDMEPTSSTSDKKLELKPFKADSAIVYKKRKVSRVKQELIEMARKLQLRRQRRSSSSSRRHSAGPTPLPLSRTGSSTDASDVDESVFRDVTVEPTAYKKKVKVEKIISPPRRSFEEAPEISIQAAAAQLVVDAVDLVMDTSRGVSFSDDPDYFTNMTRRATDRLHEMQSAPNAKSNLEDVKLEVTNIIASSQLKRLSNDYSIDRGLRGSKPHIEAVDNTLATLAYYENPRGSDVIKDTNEQRPLLDEQVTKQKVEQMELLTNIYQMATDGMLSKDDALRCIAEVGGDLGVDKLTTADYDSLQTAVEEVYGAVLLSDQPHPDEGTKGAIPSYLMWQLGTERSVASSHTTKKLKTKHSTGTGGKGVTAISLLQEKLSTEGFADKKLNFENGLKALKDAQDRHKKIAAANKDILVGMDQASSLLQNELKDNKNTAKLLILQSFLAKRTVEILDFDALRESHGDIDFQSRIDHFAALHPSIRSYLINTEFIALVDALGKDVSTISENEMRTFIEIHKLVLERADAENEEVLTSLKMLSVKGVADAALDVIKESKSSTTSPKSMTQFGFEKLGKHRLVDTLKDSIVRKCVSATSSPTSNNLLRHLLAMSKFKYMIGTMGVNPAKLKNEAYMQQMVKFYNFLYTWGIDVTTLDAQTLWDLQAIHTLRIKMSEEAGEQIDDKDFIGFHQLLQSLNKNSSLQSGRIASLMPKKILHQYFDFYKNMGRYGLSISEIDKTAHEEVVEWYTFHRRLTNNYSSLLDIDTLSKDEVTELKVTHDIHTKFNVFSTRAPNKGELEDWMKFGKMVKKMYGNSTDSIPDFTAVQKKRLLNMFNYITSAEPSALDTLTKEQLEKVLAEVTAGQTDIQKILELVRKPKMLLPIPIIIETTPSAKSLDKFMDQLEGGDDLDGLLEFTKPTPPKDQNVGFKGKDSLIAFFREELDVDTSVPLDDQTLRKLTGVRRLLSVIVESLSLDEEEGFITAMKERLQSADLRTAASLTKDEVMNILKNALSEEQYNAVKDSIRNMSIASTASPGTLKQESEDMLRELRPASNFDSGASRLALTHDSSKSLGSFRILGRSKDRMSVVTSAERFTGVPSDLSQPWEELQQADTDTLFTDSIDEVAEQQLPSSSLISTHQSSFTKMSIAQLKGKLKSTTSRPKSPSDRMDSQYSPAQQLLREDIYTEKVPSTPRVSVIVDRLPATDGLWKLPTMEPNGEYITEMGLDEYEDVVSGTRRLSDTEKKNILKDLISVKVDEDGLLTDMAKKRWKLLRAIIKMIEELKVLHDEAVRNEPEKSEANLWTSLIKAEKNGMLWTRLRTALQRAQFKDTELAKFALLVGIPPGALEAIMDEDKKKSRNSIVSVDIPAHTGSKLLLNLADSSDSVGVKGPRRKLTNLSKSTILNRRPSRSPSVNKQKRSFKGVPLGAKAGLADDETIAPTETKSLGVSLPKAAIKWKRSTMLRVDHPTTSQELTRRHSVTVPSEDDNVPHEKRLSLLEAQRRRAQKADSDLRKPFAPRERSPVLKKKGLKTDSSRTLDGAVRKRPKSKSPVDKREEDEDFPYKGLTVTFKSSSSLTKIDNIPDERKKLKYKFKTMAFIAGRFTAARIAVRKPEVAARLTLSGQFSQFEANERRSDGTMRTAAAVSSYVRIIKKRKKKGKGKTARDSNITARQSIATHGSVTSKDSGRNSRVQSKDRLRKGIGRDSRRRLEDKLSKRRGVNKDPKSKRGVGERSSLAADGQSQFFDFKDSVLSANTNMTVPHVSDSSSSFKILRGVSEDRERIPRIPAEPRKTLGVILRPAKLSISSVRSGTLPEFRNKKRLESLGLAKPPPAINIPKLSLPSIDIGDEYDDVKGSVTLPPVSSRFMMKTKMNRFDEVASIINRIANGDISPEIITKFVPIVGAEGVKPVTMKNRWQVVHDLLRAAEARPDKNGAIVSAALELMNNIKKADKKTDSKPLQVQRQLGKSLSPRSHKRKKSSQHQSATKVDSVDSVELDHPVEKTVSDVSSTARPKKKFAGKGRAKQMHSSTRTFTTPRTEDTGDEAKAKSSLPTTMESFDVGSYKSTITKRTSHSIFDSRHPSNEDLLSSDSARAVTLKAIAVDRARKKILKFMVPTNQRKQKSRDESASITPIMTISATPNVAQVSMSDSELNGESEGKDDSDNKSIRSDFSKAELNDFTVPHLPKYEERMRSRLGIKQGKMMTSTTTSAGSRQVSDLIRLAKEKESTKEMPIVEVAKDKYIWVYEWDLYEPYFTRNWTFTYHLPLPGFHQRMKQIAEEGRSLGNWRPELTQIPELPPIADKQRLTK